MLVASATYSFWVWTGILGSAVAIGAGLVKVAVAVGRAVAAVVHWNDTLRKQAALPQQFDDFREEFRRHAADDLTFQRWIVRKLDIDAAPPGMEETK